jgi:hypothetical protein
LFALSNAERQVVQLVVQPFAVVVVVVVVVVVMVVQERNPL